jgi:ankyrin repeat protein
MLLPTVSNSNLTHHPAAELTNFNNEKIVREIDQLTTAAFFGEIELVKELLDKGIDPNSRDTRGGTPLCRVASGNYDFSVDFSQILDPDNPLDSENHRKIIDILLNSGADINVVTPQFKSPLMFAAFRGYPKTVKRLLDAGADPNQKVYRKPNKLRVERIPLLDAIISGNQEVISLLIEAGVDPQDLKIFDLPTVSIATCLGREDVVLEILSSLHPDKRQKEIEARDRFGATPLIWAAITGRVKIAKLFLNFGASVDSKDIRGRTPLLRATPRGHIDVVRLLVEHGANVNMLSRNLSTPLLWAACRGRYDLMNLLLKAGADPNIVNKNDASPLYRSVSIGHTRGVELLLQYGAQKNIGRDPIFCAQNGLGRKNSSGFKDILRLLENMND